MPHWSLPRPVTSTRLMVQLAGEYGVPLERCLARTKITPEQVADEGSEIRGLQELAVLRNILHVLGPEVPFAFAAGFRYHPTAHGVWGFAQLSSLTARESIEFSLRFWDLSYSFNQLAFEIDGRVGRLIYDSSANPDDLQAAVVERDLGTLLTFEQDIHGHLLPAISLQLRGRRPPYAAELERLFGVMPEFGSDQNCVTFSADLLELRHPQGDAFGLRVSEEQCRQLQERRDSSASVSGRVRAEILRQPGEFPGMQVVAQRLGISRRTLHNQLVREGSTFRELLDEMRLLLAEELMLAPQMSVDEIAARLDYADTSSFVAAFKRWKGVPPGEYKRSLGAAEPKAIKGRAGLVKSSQ